MTDFEFWTKAFEFVNQDGFCHLVVVTESVGSAPNGVGAKMLVSKNGACIGTVGGGQAEFGIVETLKTTNISQTQAITLHHNSVAKGPKSGMICSGSQSYVVVGLAGSHLLLLQKILSTLGKKQSGLLDLSDSGINFEETHEDTKQAKTRFTRFGTGKWTYSETLGREKHLYILGAGHCGLALSRVMVTLGFHVTVLDNRPELSLMTNNPFAHEKLVIDYQNTASFVPEGDLSYVTIMTFGHRHDEMVLEKLVGKKFKYLGMMGSKHKVQTLFTNLKERGVPADFLATVHAPIGISIGSVSPEEIAISIAAEIIKNDYTETSKATPSCCLP